MENFSIWTTSGSMAEAQASPWVCWWSRVQLGEKRSLELFIAGLQGAFKGFSRPLLSYQPCIPPCPGLSPKLFVTSIHLKLCLYLADISYNELN